MKNVVYEYEVIESESDEEGGGRASCHQIATAKRIF